MEEFLKHLAWAGPLSILALAFVLKTVRTRFFQKKAQPVDLEPQAPPEAVQARETPSELTSYDEHIRAHNARVDAISREVSLAYQEAMHQAVELAQPVLLTILKPEDVKEGTPLCKIEPYPLNDIRRRDLNHEGEVVIVDHRSLTNEDWGDRFLPRHLREKYEAKRRMREACLAAAALYETRPDPAAPQQPVMYEQARPGYASTGSPALEAKTQSFEDYRDNLNQNAAQAFQEELVKILADAENKARNVFAKSQARVEEFQQEAQERGVPVSLVVDEFVQMVVKHAEDQARLSYERVAQEGGLLSVLTPERVKAGTMFQHESTNA